MTDYNYLKTKRVSLMTIIFLPKNFIVLFYFCIFATEKSCLTSKLMYNTEVRTITKSLPPLRWDAHNSLILSYSTDFGRIFRKNTTQRCGDFFENRRLDLLFPKPAAIPLHLHDNGWCQKERPCGGKKIRAANENRNFTEVFGLHDYRILISEKWIQLLSCKCF